MDPEVLLSCSEKPTPALSPEIGNQGPILTASFGYLRQDIDLPSGIFHTVFLTNILKSVLNSQVRDNSSTSFIIRNVRFMLMSSLTDIFFCCVCSSRNMSEY
jgi:hypothetical protein